MTLITNETCSKACSLAVPLLEAVNWQTHVASPNPESKTWFTHALPSQTLKEPMERCIQLLLCMSFTAHVFWHGKVIAACEVALYAKSARA